MYVFCLKGILILKYDSQVLFLLLGDTLLFEGIKKWLVVRSKGSFEVSKEGNHCLTSSDFELKGLGHQSKAKRERDTQIAL